MSKNEIFRPNTYFFEIFECLTNKSETFQKIAGRRGKGGSRERSGGGRGGGGGAGGLLCQKGECLGRK